MKIEPLACIWMLVCVMNFWAARNGKKWRYWLVRPNLRELELFHPYFVCKCHFREILMINMVIFYQNKPIVKVWKYKKSYNILCGYWIIQFSIIHVCINRSPENLCLRSLQSLLLPQFLTYRHWTGSIVKKKHVRIQTRQTYKLVILFLTNF